MSRPPPRGMMQPSLPQQPAASSVLDDVDALLSYSVDGGQRNGSSEQHSGTDGGDAFAAYFGSAGGAEADAHSNDPFASFLPQPQPAEPQRHWNAAGQQQPYRPLPTASQPSYPPPLSRPAVSATAPLPATAVRSPPPPVHQSSLLPTVCAQGAVKAISSFPSIPAQSHYPAQQPPFQPAPTTSIPQAAPRSPAPVSNAATSPPLPRQHATAAHSPPSVPSAASGAADLFAPHNTTASPDPFASYFGGTEDADSASLFSHPLPDQPARAQQPAYTHQASLRAAFSPAHPSLATPPRGSYFPAQPPPPLRNGFFSSSPAPADGDSLSYFGAGDMGLDAGNQAANDFLSYTADSSGGRGAATAHPSSEPAGYVTPPSSYHRQQPDVMSAVELNTADTATSLISPATSPLPHPGTDPWLPAPSPDDNSSFLGRAQHAAFLPRALQPQSQQQYQQSHSASTFAPHASSDQHLAAPSQSMSSGRSYPLPSSPAAHAARPSSPRPRISSVRLPHPIVSFGFGGRMIIMFPSIPTDALAAAPARSAVGSSYTADIAGAPQQMDEFELDESITSAAFPSSSSAAHSSSSAALAAAGPGRIRLYNISSLLGGSAAPELSSLTAFPGPFAGKGKEKVKEKLSRFISATVARMEDDERGGGAMSDSAVDALHRHHYAMLMWKLLGTVLLHDSDRTDRQQRAKDIAQVLTDAATDSNSSPPWKQAAPASSSSLPSNTFTLHGTTTTASSPSAQPGLQPLPPTAHLSAAMSSSSPSAASTVAASLALHEQKVHQHAVSSYLPVLLLGGKKDEAVRLALQHELFADALLLCGDDRALHGEIVRSLCAKLDEASLTRCHYFVQSGQEQQLWSQLQQAHPRLLPSSDMDAFFAHFPSSPLSLATAGTPPLFSNWRAHVGLCVCDPSPGDAAFLCHLGDSLWSVYSQPAAAHVCYLLSNTLPSLLSSVPAPSSRVVLLGGDHRRNLRGFTNISAMQMSQVYEYALSNQEGAATAAVQSCLCHQQVYRLVYAATIADLGLAEQALKYCQDIAQTVKATARKENKDGERQRPASASSDGYVYNPLFLYELGVLEHRLRVALNAPASSPVRQKLVSGLFSVLDKGINLLVGEGSAATGNSGGAASAATQSDWGLGGSRWEMTFMPQPQQPATAAGGKPDALARMQGSAGLDRPQNAAGEHPQRLSPPMYSAASLSSVSGAVGGASGFGGFQLPSAALPRSNSSSTVSAHDGSAAASLLQPTPALRSSRSGEHLQHAASGWPSNGSGDHTMAAAREPSAPLAPSFLQPPSSALAGRPPPPGAETSAFTAARTVSPPHGLYPGVRTPSPRHGDGASLLHTTHPPTPSAPPQSPAPPGLVPAAAGNTEQPASSSTQPADSNGSANGAGVGNAGLLRRLGSVGGLFSLWSGSGAGPGGDAAASRGAADSGRGRTSRTSGPREANLEQDHSFRWDELLQRYIFVDKEGREVVDNIEQPAAAKTIAAPTAVPPPALPPPRLSGGAVPTFAARGHTVTNRYALSVGESFIAPAAPSYPSLSAALPVPNRPAVPMLPAPLSTANGGYGTPFVPSGAPAAAAPPGRAGQPPQPSGTVPFDPASILTAPLPGQFP